MNIAVRAFRAGELAPALHAQTTMAKYAEGLRQCRNFVVMKSGGAQNRPGTVYVGPVRGDVDDPVRYIPWVRSDAEAFLLEFVDARMRVIHNGDYIEWSTTPSWANVTDYVQGDVVANGGVDYVALAGHLSSPLTEPGVGGVWATWWAVTAEPVFALEVPYAATDLAGVRVAQDADVMTLVHPDYPVQELTHGVDDDDWSIADAVFGPTQAGPSALGTSGGAASGSSTGYAVSALSDETGEEAAGLVVAALKVPTSGSPITVTWTAPAGATRFRVYRQTPAGTYAFIGVAAAVAGAGSFVDDDIDPDETQTPPTARYSFGATDAYPGAVTHYQQRRLFARSNAAPETTWASRSALPRNFSVSSITRDDDALAWRLRGQQVAEVRHLVDHNGLIEFTSQGAYDIQGDANGVLTPSGVNPKRISPYGVSDLGTLAPISVGAALLYAQSRGTVVRDLALTDTGAYGGADVTVYASHLFEGYSLVDMTMQRLPDPILWALRSDGTLLGCTYVREYDVLAWHQHTLGGAAPDGAASPQVDAIGVVPEGDEDAVYLAVLRTVDGSAVRYCERLCSRTLRAAPADAGALDDDPRVIDAACFMDSAVVTDAWAQPSLGDSITLSGASYAAGAALTLTASGFTPFAAPDVGRTVILEDTAGRRVRLTVTAYTSSSVVTVEPESPVPASLQATSATRYAFGATSVTGLDHLEGESVSVVADGEVVANPLDPDFTAIVVASGAVTLPKAFAHVRVGLPYTADLETLDIDVAGGSSIKPEAKLVAKAAGLMVLRTRALLVGSDATHLTDVVFRRTATWSGIPPLETGYYEASIAAGPTSHGRVLVRSRDPLPATVLSIMPVFDR